MGCDISAFSIGPVCSRKLTSQRPPQVGAMVHDVVHHALADLATHVLSTTLIEETSPARQEQGFGLGATLAPFR